MPAAPTPKTLCHFSADDGQSIHFAASGEGPPLILLHGWTASHQEWFPFLPALEARHRVLRWDARGHAGHPLTHGAPTVTRMARDLANFLDHKKLKEAVVIGHSMGALTLWQYIRDFGTERLAGVGIIDQSPRLLTDPNWPHGIYGDFPEARSREFLASLEADFAEGVLRLGAFGLNERAREKYEANAPGWEKARRWLRALAPNPLIACWQSLVAADYRDVLAKIDVPALLVYGGESNFYRVETARYVADQIPAAVLHIYEDTDHSPHQWQRERFAQDILAFTGSLRY